ncbi:MAG: glycosyltransferase family 2 protein, partial [Muribaculaceae bacterium]|nr:glycosyltransferase family 2 protein [Muribaculaceae bacterium]
MSQVKLRNNQPLVSVIIPVYNMQEYLAECVTSVLASTHSPLEVVIVDDGSTDGSLAVARDLAATDERITVITQPNSGVSRARNHAIEEARGEFILPVDGDDRIAPQYIEHALRHFEADPDVKVVTACGEFFGNRSGRWELPAFDRHLLARRNLISVCALYRKAHWA